MLLFSPRLLLPLASECLDDRACCLHSHWRHEDREINASGTKCLELFPAARDRPKQADRIQETVAERILAHPAFHERGLVGIPHSPEQALEERKVDILRPLKEADSLVGL